MKQVKWLFEKDTFEENINGMFYAADELGIEYQVVDYKPFMDKHDYRNLFCDNDCVVAHGSIQLCYALNKYCSWIPTTYASFDNYKCTEYYPRLSQFLLNENYVMLPYGELRRRKEFLFSSVGEDKCIFVRPDAGTKLFTGKLVKYEQFEADVDMFGFYETKPSDLVIVASPRNIIHEWRLLVVNKEVVTGSMYRPDKKREVPQAVVDYANNVAQVYQPDNCFVVDVGETKTDLYLIEIGSFSCAGMYQCDPKTIIEKVSEQAWKDWNDFYS